VYEGLVMHYLNDFLFALGILICWLLAQFLILPYIKLQMRRRESWTHTPQPEEIWMQDSDLLYVDAVSSSGVELMSYDVKNGTFFKWKDTWDEWNKRLKMRTLWYTGQRRPLR
jgi:hypothetical protein